MKEIKNQEVAKPDLNKEKDECLLNKDKTRAFPPMGNRCDVVECGNNKGGICNY